ncbi:MAG: bifunctional methylenetetrahydrofolate dehydrogenase/methenyltetrahydrofolate cyclohydrolase FolD [Gammaproteobacteria bacterium]
MNASLLDGKALASSLMNDIRQTVKKLPTKPGLAVVMLGDNDASRVYVQRKRDICGEVGINSFAYDLPATTTQSELLMLIDKLNQDHDVSGILVQLPLPEHINSQAIIEAINPNKDVDGFHPYNLGRLVQRHPTLRPCTPAGIMTLLDYYKLPLAGKHAVVVGASNIVGRPMALELLMAGCTVTICHSATLDLQYHVAHADILVTAMGCCNVIQSGWIKSGAVVVDVAMNRDAQGKLCGDLDFTKAATRASWITPVPGGVGPMTIATLMQNTVQCYRLIHE